MTTYLWSIAVLAAVASGVVLGSWLQRENYGITRRLAKKVWHQQAGELRRLRYHADALQREHLKYEEQAHSILRRFIMVEKQPLEEEEKERRRKLLEQEANLLWVSMLDEESKRMATLNYPEVPVTKH